MNQSWEHLKKECAQCTKCQLGALRTNVVFGVGNEQARILFVGEGPGEQEDLQGEPFVGAAGMLLDDMLRIIDLDRKHNCYIANVVKCRPPRNRDPLDEEQAACEAYLAQQIQLLQPRILICLGRIAAKKLIDPDYRITAQHGSWVKKTIYGVEGIEVTAIYHPSALLRDPSKRPETFSDLMSIRQKMKELGIE